jgi:hypothetical protein
VFVLSGGHLFFPTEETSKENLKNSLFDGKAIDCTFSMVKYLG